MLTLILVTNNKEDLFKLMEMLLITFLKFIYDNIVMDGYEVYGLCQYNGVLDYVVALELNSNEIRVIRFTTDAFNTEILYIKDYKKVDKDDLNKKIVGGLFVDCAFQGVYKNQNYYTIGIAGTYLHSNAISSYYLAKFSTKYNFTEYIILSEDNTTMETVEGVSVDFDNQMIYLAVGINKQIYFGRTVYEPGQKPGQDNANVAIHGCSWTFGNRMWTTVIGNPEFIDQFGRMKAYGNNLYVFLNSYSTKYSNDSSQTDIYYYRLRPNNGYISAQEIFGSPKEDRIFDLYITFTGLYILGKIDNSLLPHRNNDREWQTQDSTSNIGIIWMDFEDKILDIEGFSFNKTVNPYPMKLFVPRTVDDYQQFVFVSPRTNNPIDIHGGLFITYPSNNNQLFSQFVSCGDTCQKCSPALLTKCMQCRTGYFLFKNKCYIDQCPDFSYNLIDTNKKKLKICQECHYTCKTCNGPKQDQCATCCTDNICGPIYNRIPNLGKCECPSGLVDSNGICVQRCILNLAGRRNDICYPQCPDNSFPFLKYDGASSAQERSQYDQSQPKDCQQSINHMRFSLTGKGIPVLGPANLSSVPDEFTIGIWVRPVQLNPNSYFVNAFDRIHIRAQSSTNRVFFSFRTGASTFQDPTYSNDAKQRVVLNSWNYIMVSQRNIVTNQILRYEQQLAICNDNTALGNAGYLATTPTVFYAAFTNTIYLGSLNDQNPQSFNGFLKEFKLFSKYHSFAQMQDELWRTYRHYSYDDPNLISYWKLNEPYSQNDIEYTVYDYSMNQNQITYSRYSKPDYPTYVQNESFSLNLCYFHDVKVCLSPEYDETHPYVAHGKRLTRPPTFQLKNSQSLTISHGDQLWFMPNNTKCIFANALAYMTYQGYFRQDWVVPDSNLSPVNLKESLHYKVCYYSSSLGQSFNLYQVYIIEQPTTIDPSTNDAFMSDGVSRTWNSNGGDQGLGDIIKFSRNCDSPSNNDYEMTRNYKPSYGSHQMKNFAKAGDFFFCWQHNFVQETANPYYQAANELRFRVVGVPTISTSQQTVVRVNEDLVQFNLFGAFADGDKIAFSWKGYPISDCNPANFIGYQYSRIYNNFPSVWFGYTTGISGINNTSMDELHLCYMSAASDAPTAWSRIKKTTGASYQVQVKEYDVAINTKCPELIGFSPSYGSSELTESENTIRFTFKSQAVYPSRVSDSPLVYGKIIIYRGAIKPDGEVIKTTDILWSNTQLNDLATPNAFSQGDLICSGAGACSIILSQPSNRMKGGEVYFLSFFLNSFAAKTSAASTTRNYLFNDKTLDTGAGQTTAYDHYFICRSFKINNSTNVINGKVLTVTGTDLLTKTIKAQELEGRPQSALFTTKAINMKLVVKNTDNGYCINNPPVATVLMKDVTQTSFTIYNLELRQCNQGLLFAEVELVRGIKDQYGAFTHVKSEIQKDIQLGTIGCDPSCLYCNGTTFKDCLVCADQSMMLYQGSCYSQCPSNIPYFVDNNIIIQRTLYIAHTCVPQCPSGLYADPLTKECLECNSDCQTCNSSYAASCLTCEPIKYLFNGVCLDECPSPYHKSNFSSYNCDQIGSTRYLKVKIQNIGYKKRIPKDIQMYLKASISNEGGGQILSILWEQLEPYPETDEISIFTKTKEGDIQNREAVIKVKMTAFNFMAMNQVIKVKVTVINSLNEIAYDVYEFYQNSPPAVGNLTLSIVNGVQGAGNGTAVDTLFRFQLSNWTDTYQHFELPTMYRVYMKLESTYYTLTDQTTNETIFFRIPVFSTTDLNQNISLCISATDYHEASSTQCIRVWNINNTLKYAQDYQFLITDLKTLNYTRNMSNVIYAANQLFFAMMAPRRNPSAPGLCTLDYHCNYNGRCLSNSGIQRCVCEPGFSGTFCQFQGSHLNELKGLATSMINELSRNIGSKLEMRGNDVEVVGTVVRGLLKDPDLLDDSKIDLVLDLIDKIIDAPIYVHYPVSKDVRSIFLDALTGITNKIFHAYGVSRAMSQSQILADGKSLQEQASNRGRMLGSNSNYLIGGFGAKLARMSSQSELETGSIYQQWGRRLDREINTYINQQISSLNPNGPKFTYISNAFMLLLQSDYATTFKGQQLFIKERDAYWEIPEQIFSNSQGSASDKNEVTLKIMKYIANPFLFEENPGGFVESNVTTVTFFDTQGEPIKIDLSNSNAYLEIKEAHIKTEAYEDELFRCMAWNDEEYQFENDNSCSAQIITESIPCLTCDETSPIITKVTICRCKHLSRFAVVYQQTVPSIGKGVQVGVYSDFFAMNYWTESFGLIAVISGSAVFAVGHLIMFLLDRKRKVLILERLRDRMKKLELKGFTQINQHQKKLKVKRDLDGKIIFVRLNQDKEEKKEAEVHEVTPVTELKRPEESLKKSKKKLLNKKKFNEEADEVHEVEFLQAKGRKNKTKKNTNKIQDMSRVIDEEREPTAINDPNGYQADNKSSTDNLGPGNDPSVNHDLFEQQMLRKYEEEKEIREFVRVHGTSSSEEDMGEKQRSKEQKRYLKIEKKQKEIYWYNWKQLLIHGNYITSIIYVDSFLSPRHVRWTLLFTCVLLNWFWCAVIYNNTKDPLALPDFDREPRDLAGDDMWISIVSPLGTVILMYVFGGLFKLSDQRLEHSYTTAYLDLALYKEMRLRFFIAYSITLAIYSAIFYYVIRFTTSFGWNVSWTWFYQGLFSIFFQLAFIDNAVSLIHWVTYYCSRTLAIFWMKIRIIKQAKMEA